MLVWQSFLTLKAQGRPSPTSACPCGQENSSFIKTRRIWFCYVCKKQFIVNVGLVMDTGRIRDRLCKCGKQSTLAAPFPQRKLVEPDGLESLEKVHCLNCGLAQGLPIERPPSWLLSLVSRFARARCFCWPYEHNLYMTTSAAPLSLARRLLGRDQGYSITPLLCI